MKPISFATGASRSWLRNHFIATRNMPMGNRNAEKPQNWKKRSAMWAPTGPIQLRAGPAPGGGAETLNEASRGEYESRLRASRMARLRPTKPISSLRRLFSVGVRIRTTISPFFLLARRRSLTAGLYDRSARRGGNRAPKDAAVGRPQALHLRLGTNRGRPPRRKPGVRRR